MGDVLSPSESRGRELHITTHDHKGAAGDGSGVCAPHRFTGRQAPPKKNVSAGPVQTASVMQNVGMKSRAMIASMGLTDTG